MDDTDLGSHSGTDNDSNGCSVVDQRTGKQIVDPILHSSLLLIDWLDLFIHGVGFACQNRLICLKGDSFQCHHPQVSRYSITLFDFDDIA